MKIKNGFRYFVHFVMILPEIKNPSHGHCYISKKNIPYFKCFRCSESGNLTKLLIHTGFENISELAKLKSHINFDLISNKKTYNFKKANNYEIISSQQDVDDDNKYRFYDYFNNRCNGISPEKFGIYPISPAFRGWYGLKQFVHHFLRGGTLISPAFRGWYGLKQNFINNSLKRHLLLVLTEFC